MADIRPLEFPATDLVALDQARKLMADYLERAEAVSVGCPTQITETPGRMLVLVTQRSGGKGWILEGQMVPGSWHRELLDAINYGAYRTAGSETEIRIRNAKSQVTHVVLIPAVKRRMTLY
jgi:hypothetical protein